MSKDIKITIAWQNPLPHDDLQSLQAAILKKQIGISDTTIQREQGYDPEEEQALSQVEDAAKMQALAAAQIPQSGDQVPVPGEPLAAQPQPGQQGQGGLP